jgi:hypothetical protein
MADEIGVCGAGMCDNPAVTYLFRTPTRVTAVVGARAVELGAAHPGELSGVLELRCADCAHNELDDLIGGGMVAGVLADRQRREVNSRG